jgi:hypothetical protein
MMLMEINADQYVFPLYLTLIPFLFVPVITCFFHSMLHASEIRSTVTSEIGIFIAGKNHTVENKPLGLLVKWKYQIPSKIPTKYLRIFVFFHGASKQLLK